MEYRATDGDAVGVGLTGGTGRMDPVDSMEIGLLGFCGLSLLELVRDNIFSVGSFWLNNRLPSISACYRTIAGLLGRIAHVISSITCFHVPKRPGSPVWLSRVIPRHREVLAASGGGTPYRVIV